MFRMVESREFFPNSGWPDLWVGEGEGGREEKRSIFAITREAKARTTDRPTRVLPCGTAMASVRVSIPEGLDVLLEFHTQVSTQTYEQ
jgi:hypothetical protein